MAHFDVVTMGTMFDFARMLDIACASLGHRSEFAMVSKICRRGIVVDTRKLIDWRRKWEDLG